MRCRCLTGPSKQDFVRWGLLPRQRPLGVPHEGEFGPVLVAMIAHGALVVLPVVLPGAPEKRSEQLALRMVLPPRAPAVQRVVTKPHPPVLQNKPKRVVRRPIPRPIARPKTSAPIAVAKPVLKPEPEERIDERDAPPPVQPSLPPTVEPAQAVDLRAYGRSIHGAVLRHRRYPIAARRMRLQGKVLVKLRVTRSGQLAGAPGVYRSSGHQVLDREALRMVRDAAPFAAMRGRFERDAAVIVIPVRFVLDS